MLFRCAWEVKADPEQPPTPTAPEHAQCGFLVLVFRPWPFRSPATGSQLHLPARDLPREPGLLSPPRCRHPLVLLLVRELGGGGRLESTPATEDRRAGAGCGCFHGHSSQFKRFVFIFRACDSCHNFNIF